FVARHKFPHPRDLEVKQAHFETAGISRRFWLYAVGAGFIAAGYADFPLIAFHLAKRSEFSSHAIPLLYALAMGTAAIAALAFGKLFDRVGVGSTILGIVMGAGFAPLAFLGGRNDAIAGVALW